MKRKESFLPVFFVVAFLCIIILILSLSGNLKFITSFLEKRTSQIQGITFHIFKNLPFVSENLKIKNLREENLELLSRIADQEKLKKENSALSDQFQISYPSSARLLKAEIIGAPGFIPGVSNPTNFILNKGSKDNIKVGQAVVVKDNLVGVISTVSVNLSKVSLINNTSSSFTAKTESNAEGIIKGGASLTLNNVLLSENIRKMELVLTKGDVNSDGVGIPPDLIVGKVISVDKNPSDLFQKAKIESFVDFARLSSVFVYSQNK